MLWTQLSKHFTYIISINLQMSRWENRILIKQITEMSTEKLSHLLGGTQTVICWIPKPMILATLFPYFRKRREHNEVTLNQTIFDILRSVFWKRSELVSSYCWKKLTQAWCLKIIQKISTIGRSKQNNNNKLLQFWGRKSEMDFTGFWRL